MTTGAVLAKDRRNILMKIDSCSERRQCDVRENKCVQKFHDLVLKQEFSAGHQRPEEIFHDAAAFGTASAACACGEGSRGSNLPKRGGVSSPDPSSGVLPPAELSITTSLPVLRRPGGLRARQGPLPPFFLSTKFVRPIVGFASASGYLWMKTMKNQKKMYAVH